MSLNIYKGELTILLGHNGAGKTTLFSILSGLEAPTFGVVTMNGLDMERNKSALGKHMGFCPQNSILWPTLTLAEHLHIISRLKRTAADKGASHANQTKMYGDMVSTMGLHECQSTPRPQMKMQKLFRRPPTQVDFYQHQTIQHAGPQPKVEKRLKHMGFAYL